MLSESPKSPSELIFDILDRNKSVFYSVSEIVKEIFEMYSYNYDYDTVVKHIDILKRTGHTIAERFERRGEKKVTTKCFSLIKIDT